MRIPYEILDHGKVQTKKSSKTKKRKIPDGMILVSTCYGEFIIPNYSSFTPEQTKQEKHAWEMRFWSLNDTYKKDGFTIAMPSDTESLTDMAVRYESYVHYIKQNNGCDIYKLLISAAWMIIEIVAKRIGYKAHGYFESQMQQFDIYQNKLVKMGRVGSIGEEWSPMTQIAVMSGINLIIIILLNKTFKGNSEVNNEKRLKMMRYVAQFIGGKGEKTDPIGDELTKAGLDTGLDLTNVITTGLDLFGGEEEPKKKKKEEKIENKASALKEKRENRKRGPKH